MATFTNAGLNLIAQAVQSPGVNAAITYVAVGTGCGALASGLTANSVYTSLALTAGLPANVASGTSLTITDGVNSQLVTTNATALAGATSLSVAGFTAAYTFAATTTGVAPTPQASDLTLYNEVARIAALPGVAGAVAGESLNSAYFDSTQPTNLYMQVGYFGGAAASSTLGSGTLIGEDIQYWNHVLNGDSATFQGDNII